MINVNNVLKEFEYLKVTKQTEEQVRKGLFTTDTKTMHKTTFRYAYKEFTVTHFENENRVTATINDFSFFMDTEEDFRTFLTNVCDSRIDGILTEMQAEHDAEEQRINEHLTGFADVFDDWAVAETYRKMGMAL